MAMYLARASCTLNSAVPITLPISANFPGSLSSALPLSVRRGKGRGHVKFGCCFQHARPLAARLCVCVCVFCFVLFFSLAILFSFSLSLFLA